MNSSPIRANRDRTGEIGEDGPGFGFVDECRVPHQILFEPIPERLVFGSLNKKSTPCSVFRMWLYFAAKS